MHKVNTILIGVGHHARRIYLPYIKDSEYCNLVACWDLLSQKERVEMFLHNVGIKSPCFYAKNDHISDTLDSEDRLLLDDLVKKFDVEAVIIATEPLSHLKYAKWALDKGLHILMDKPISTEIDVSTNTQKAQKLFQDYKELANAYIEKNKSSFLVFSIQAQRRFHAGFKLVREKVIEIARLSQCPVTFIQTFHCDGQWTFPQEFLDQQYHPYNQGYGKMSHSGFHGLDVALWLADASLTANKRWDRFKLTTSFTRPSDVLAQLTKEDYLKVFPGMQWDSRVIGEIDQVTGEVDAFTHISLLRGGDTITHISCNSLHNGFSRREWISSEGRDLYKGNGRVRQESYVIEQGPFQSIVINSFQSEEIQKNNAGPYTVGGEYHFDIHVFRNKVLFPESSSYEFFNLQSLSPVEDRGYSRGHQEDARRSCIIDFFRSIINRLPHESQGANILHHSLTTQLLSSIYVSASKQYIGQGGEVDEKIDYITAKNKSYVE